MKQRLASSGILTVPAFSPYTFEDSAAFFHYGQGEDRRTVAARAASGPAGSDM